MNVEKRLKSIISSWFYTEPLLFSVSCTHNLVQNDSMQVPLRTGKMRIEFSPSLLESKSDDELAILLKIENYRILLKHPYERQPYNAQKKILLLASDAALYQFLNNDEKEKSSLAGIEFLKSLSLGYRKIDYLLEKHSFEEWYRLILNLITELSGSGENAGSSSSAENFSSQTEQASELWEENPEALAKIGDEIKKAEVDQGWGGLGGELSRELKGGEDFSFDYRRALTQFRQNIVAANRTLTRMRPSRRYGFKAMGSRYERKANVLIAVDVSGSITDESFAHFTHAVKNFFFLGIIEKIDLIFFDVNLKNTKPISFRKKTELKDIKGRGGTNFQVAIDFFEEHSSEYSGLIIFTDGQGDIPLVKGCGQILWILESRASYDKSRQWISTLNGCKATYLPF